MRKAFVSILALGLAVMGAGAAQAKTTKGNYAFSITSTLNCVARDSAGAVVGRMSLTGSGTFSTYKPRPASGGGTWSWADAGGAVVDSGSWSISKLNSFHSYGGTNDNVGGDAKFDASFAGGSKTWKGKVWITNAAGKTPKGKPEGCRALLKDTMNFNKPASGAVSMTRSA